jgi:hypothetical protein
VWSSFRWRYRLRLSSVRCYQASRSLRASNDESLCWEGLQGCLVLLPSSACYRMSLFHCFCRTILEPLPLPTFDCKAETKGSLSRRERRGFAWFIHCTRGFHTRVTRRTRGSPRAHALRVEEYQQQQRRPAAALPQGCGRQSVVRTRAGLV